MRGRPSLQALIERTVREIGVFHKKGKGFPSFIEADEIWKDIWLEETHHSTALEGNTLTTREVYRLVEQELVTGSKEMRHYLEVRGYANAARWVYEEGVAAFKRREKTLSLQHIRHIHQLLMEPVWTTYPPVTGDKPGQIRTGRAPRIRGSSLKLPPSGDVPDLLDHLIKVINTGPKTEPIPWLSEIHAKFEVIHPFIDGNGRTGRLLLNYLLISFGFPPAIILKSQRPKYIRAMERAQGKQPDYTMLTELIARSVRDNLNKLMLPKLATEQDLVPLSSLAEGTPYNPNYLRRLAQEGKLKAVKDGTIWVSSKKWLQQYIEARSPRGRR